MCVCVCVRERGVFFFLSFFSGGWGWGIEISVYVCLSVCVPGQGVLNSQPFVTKLGMVMHHHEPECHAKNVA